ncbi:hypothetical protein [Endozoicomonas euniceicola]|uniref:Restriction endonuclease n=1 Tax=Endozoicomonas euniceicola TaxID=1234143 RepID=A0ABY6GVY2_9GAMM|nr:hypothetical protein [Endozoicomonas euniceicola]UYM16213.1 hypothetical protein NX720_26025 [Endozoicomonas euniceicola]
MDTTKFSKDVLIEACETLERNHSLSNEPEYFANPTNASILFRKNISKKSTRVIDTHHQAIFNCVKNILEKNDSYRYDNLLITEFARDITTFDCLTESLKLKSKTYADRYLTSSDIYMDAQSAYRGPIVKSYTANFDFALLPMKLRLAIEVYFKNMIGFIKAEYKIKKGHKKNKTGDEQIQISQILNFFSEDENKEFANLPVDILLIKYINFWSNSFVHSGIISLAWQGLTAVELLSPLFNSNNHDGRIDINGFNYINLSKTEIELQSKISRYLSTDFKDVNILLEKRRARPIEGSYAKPENALTK